MLIFIAFMAAMFFLMLFNTIYYIVHKPDRYLPPAIITALLGGFLIFLILSALD